MTSFYEIVMQARRLLERNSRVSLRGLKREFDLDDDAVEELVEELVDVQQVAAREGKVLAWMGSAAGGPEPAIGATTQAVAFDREAPAEAERRQLTVLFCDLVDSTELAAELGPEDWGEVVGCYQRAAGEVVARYGGHVAQHLGDGLLAYFGWPQAHEDDAERALRAGRDLLRAVDAQTATRRDGSRVTLVARVGVHTGPVVVGAVGEGSKAETLALGETTHLAARIQTEAEPGALLASEATLHLVPGIFVTEELGPRSLKGSPAPLFLHRVIQPAGVRSRLDVGRARWTRFVGREQELGLLVDRWEQACEGEGQTVFLSGDAGLGKSRLALALHEHVGDQPHIWLECRASPYTRGSAFHPVTELVLQGIRVRPEDAPEAKLRNLETGVRDAGLDTERVVPLMADLLGIPLDGAYPPLQLSPELQRERTLEAFVAWALALAGIQPLLLLVEDLHWCDPSSLELFGRLIDQLPTRPVLLVMTARPEFELPWKAPKSWTPIALGRLRRRAARELARAVTGTHELSADAFEQILERADGVPLYLEELTRAALESAETGSEAAIPTTLQDSLMARLDRLSTAKEVAQLASVLGREFSYPLLREVAGLDETALRRGLERLVEADLLFRRGAPPEAVYTFKHALVQEAAYESLLRRRRQGIHRSAARVLAEPAAERAPAEPGVVALHCERGGLPEEAARHYLLAGEVAAARSAHEEAVAYLERCLAQLGEIAVGPERNGLELTAQTTLGTSIQFTRGFTNADAKAAYERAQELCEVVEDPDRLLSALYGLGSVQQTTGELERSTRSARAICKQAETTGRSLDRVVGHQLLGANHYVRGAFREAAESLAIAIDAYEASQSAALVEVCGHDIGMVALAYDAQNLWCAGRPNAAAARAREVAGEVRSLGHPFTTAFIQVFVATLFGMGREAEICELHATEALEISEAHGYPVWLGAARLVVGWAHAGRPGAVEEVQAGMAIAGATGNQGLIPLILGVLSETCHAGSRFAEALSAAELGLTLGATTGQHFWDAELLRRQAEARRCIGDGDAAQVEALLERALATARSQEAKSLELRAATSLARLWQSRGKRPEACDLLQPVYDWFTEGFDTQDLKDAKALLEELG